MVPKTARIEREGDPILEPAQTPHQLGNREGS